MEDTYDDEFSFPFLNLNKILNNSTPGKVTCIWHIEWVEIDAMKFERRQIHFFSDVFTTVVVKVPIIGNSKRRTETPSKSLKKPLLRQGRLYTIGKVIQRLFNINLYTYLAIFRYGWGKR